MCGLVFFSCCFSLSFQKTSYLIFKSKKKRKFITRPSLRLSLKTEGEKPPWNQTNKNSFSLSLPLPQRCRTPSLVSSPTHCPSLLARMLSAFSFRNAFLFLFTSGSSLIMS